MKIKKLQVLMNPNLQVRINDPNHTQSWVGNCGEIPHSYLNRKIVSLNPDYISFEGQWEYDCIDVWIEALPDTICRGLNE